MQAVFEKPLPPDVYCGVGVAQAEADGEAIFWAENRAREAIAQQLAAAVNAPSIEDDYDEADFSLEDFFMENFGEDAWQQRYYGRRLSGRRYHPAPVRNVCREAHGCPPL